MRLYLNANSKNNIGYTPDWIQVSFIEDEIVYELTFDIQGTIDYDPHSLSCVCKGELIPWTLWNLETGDETDLSELTEEEIMLNYSNKRIAEIFQKGFDHLVGIYPVNDTEGCICDVLSKCEGGVELYLEEDYFYTKEFKFTTELNY